MSEASGAERIFGLDPAQQRHYDDAARELAFALSAAAATSFDELDGALRRCVQAALAGRPEDPTHVVLTLTVRRLAGMVRSLTRGGSASTHPLADAVRRHSTLEQLEGEQLVGAVEKWLRDGAPA